MGLRQLAWTTPPNSARKPVFFLVFIVSMIDFSLDDVLYLLLQAKILRVIQEKEVERLGGKKTIKLNVRIIATTNRDLKQEVAENPIGVGDTIDSITIHDSTDELFEAHKDRIASWS